MAFSCKGRGVCPSCNAKRAHVTAAHLLEEVLPRVPWRQWTSSFPVRVRWVLARDAGLLSEVLAVFLRAVFALQRRRELDVRPPPRQQPRCAFLEGFSLHANTHLHAHDRYGARAADGRDRQTCAIQARSTRSCPARSGPDG